MSKLLALKKWLTVPDTARYLSILFDEIVGEADVLRLALDGRLKLSVRFVNNAYASCGKVIASDYDDDRFVEGPGLERIMFDLVLQHDEKIELIYGVWDLMMLGAEQDHVEREWQKLSGGPEVTVNSTHAVLLSQENGSACILHQYAGDTQPDPWVDPPSEYIRAVTLPRDAHLVVRTGALRELEKSLSNLEKQQARPLGTKERHNLLVIVAALAEMAKLDISKPSKAAIAIEQQILSTGAAGPLKRAIEDHLKRSREVYGHRAEYPAED